MGRLEKIVVLTVLFLVAVVLGVALTPSGGKSSREGARGPVQGTLDPQLPATAETAKPEKVDGLLNAEAKLPAPSGTAAPAVIEPKSAVQTAPPPSTAPAVPVAPVAPGAPVEKPPAPYVVSTEGLLPSEAPNMMFYAWKQGDTFAALAQRFYGSKDKVARLTKANEGRTEASLKVDERIWVPIAESSKQALADDGGKVYVVKAGDVLSNISQQFYGTSKKWQKILDANRDTLSSPEKLKPGMRLRIPE